MVVVQRASHRGGFSFCGACALGAGASVVVANGLSCPTACGIFPDQGLTGVLCIARQIPNHWTTGEAQGRPFKLMDLR